MYTVDEKRGKVFIVKKVRKQKTLKEQVYEYLKERIILGKMKPGERLIEEKIAEELGISRSPIREAVRMLEKDGLLLVNKKGGVTVVKPTIEDYKYLYECRIEIESLAAFYAALRRTPEELAMLKEQFSEMERVKNHPTLVEVHEINNIFHETIIKASKNPFLIAITSQLRGVKTFYRGAILEVNPFRMEHAIVEHSKIFQAIENKDAEAARTSMRMHIESDYRHFEELIAKK